MICGKDLQTKNQNPDWLVFVFTTRQSPSTNTISSKFDDDEADDTIIGAIFGNHPPSV